MKNSFVEIYALQDNGTQKAVVICRLVGNAVKCEGNSLLIEQLETKGIQDYSVQHPTKLFLKDGRRFLENLKFAFRSGYLEASEIKEE